MRRHEVPAEEGPVRPVRGGRAPPQRKSSAAAARRLLGLRYFRMVTWSPGLAPVSQDRSLVKESARTETGYVGSDVNNHCRCASRKLPLSSLGATPARRYHGQNAPLSERDLGSHRDRIEFGADIGGIGGALLAGNIAMQVVEHEPDIPVHIPVQPGRIDGLSSARDAGCGSEPIVEVDRADAAADLPWAPTDRDKAVTQILMLGSTTRSRAERRARRLLPTSTAGGRGGPAARCGTKR